MLTQDLPGNIARMKRGSDAHDCSHVFTTSTVTWTRNVDDIKITIYSDENIKIHRSSMIRSDEDSSIQILGY